MRKISLPTENRNEAFPKEFLAFLKTRAAESMGAQLGELAAICGGARAAYAAIENLTGRGWVIGEKLHSNGRPFFFLISGPGGLAYSTKHFCHEALSGRPMLPARDGF
jgi:hypothetical protein